MKATLMAAILMSLFVSLFSYDLDDYWGSNNQSNSNSYGSLYGNNNNSSLYSTPKYNPNYQYNYNNSNFGKSYTKPYKDSWGNSYRYQDNLWKDTDKDGVINYYDYNDKNKKVQTKSQSDYYKLYKW